MNGRRGAVWHEDRRVGALREDENRVLRFAYDGAWLDGGGFPVSIHLPLSLGDEEVDAHAFFAGLLPEGGTRQRICRQRGISLPLLEAQASSEIENIVTTSCGIVLPRPTGRH